MPAAKGGILEQSQKFEPVLVLHDITQSTVIYMWPVWSTEARRQQIPHMRNQQVLILSRGSLSKEPR